MTNILSILESAPAKIASAAEKVRQKKGALDTAKNNLRVAEALATVTHQDAKNQRLLDALIALDDGVKLARNGLIAATADHESALIELNRQTDAFISARKLAGMDQKELDAIRGSTIQLSE